MRAKVFMKVLHLSKQHSLIEETGPTIRSSQKPELSLTLEAMLVPPVFGAWWPIATAQSQPPSYQSDGVKRQLM